MNRFSLPRRQTATIVAPLLVGALVLGACTSGDEEPQADPTTTEPGFELVDVVGERVTAVYSLDSRGLLGLGTGPEPDHDVIDTATQQVGDWLDTHLDGLQRDGDGSFGAIAADGLRPSAGARRPITTDLASPEDPVVSARYTISAYHDGMPEFLTAVVEVTHPDDTVSMASLVFVVAEDGTPHLTMFGPDEEVAG